MGPNRKVSMRNLLTAALLLASTRAWPQQIKSVNFLQEGEVSKLVLELDAPVVAERFHVQDDKQIILDVKNAKADPKVLRGIDTSEFNGAAVYISGYPRPGAPSDLRFAIQLRDNVRSILETQGNKLVLSIENRFGVFSRGKLEGQSSGVKTSAAEAAPTAEDRLRLHVPKSSAVEDILENLTLSGPKKYIGKRISINVKDIPLKELLGMIADTSGFNIIIDSAVDKVPPLTLSLTNIPWDQALDTILTLSKLVATKNANILSVKTVEQATAEKKAMAEAEKLKLGLEPLVTKVFAISYADLPSLQTIIKDYLTPERGTMQQDVRTNSLIVKDTVDSIERIKKIVELLDTQTPQILIESKIVEATAGQSKRMGLTNGLQFGYDPVRINAVGNPVPVGPGFSFSSAPGSNAPGFMGFTIQTYKRLSNLNFTLEMMESESKARIVTAPKVITQNKKPANISSTETVNFLVVAPQVGGINTASIVPVSITLNLTVTPQVTNEGAINMDVELQKGSFGAQSAPTAPPATIQRQLRTNVLVDNGSTVVLGGLYSSSSTESHSGVPFLKDLPLVGWLFRTPYNPTENRNELLVFLTPRIINQEEAGMSERGAAASTATRL